MYRGVEAAFLMLPKTLLFASKAEMLLLFKSFRHGTNTTVLFNHTTLSLCRILYTIGAAAVVMMISGII